MVIECGYDEDRQMFYVSYLSKITPDRRNINIKRSFKIDGRLSFILNTRSRDMILQIMQNC